MENKKRPNMWNADSWMNRVVGGLPMYILVGQDTKEVDIDTWMKWMDGVNLELCTSNITKDIKVCSVFTALDRNYSAEGPPILFETTVHGGKSNGWTTQYSTYNLAVIGHFNVLGIVEKKEKDDGV